MIKAKTMGQETHELEEKNLPNDFEPGTFKTLAFIHTYLFQDQVKEAGKIRKTIFYKDNFSYLRPLYLEKVVRIIEKMPDQTFDQIIEKYLEINFAHPFYDGNERALQIWLNHLLINRLNQSIDWSKINERDYIRALKQAFLMSMDLEPLKLLMKNALRN